MSQVVVVEDDPTNATLTKMLLEMDGFTVTACHSAQEAEETIAADTSAFVIDVNLARGLSGIDLLRNIRAGQTRSPAETIVIMTSGDARRSDDCLQAGANDFLLKPYSPDKLSQLLKKLLKGNS
jgi:CheY-like chemotaxis protein